MSNIGRLYELDWMFRTPRWWRLLAVCLWMGVIFSFSAQAHSGEITQRYLGAFNVFVRKCAHMTEYAILFALIRWSLLARGSGRSIKLSLLALAMVAAYAATDEYHQLFVPGRSGQPSDVLVDSSCALVCLLVWHYFAALRSSWFKTRG